jgi:ABC-2 type transport system permease protein
MWIYWAVKGNFPGFDGFPAWYLFAVRLNPGYSLNAISLTFLDFVGPEDINIAAAMVVQLTVWNF